MKGLLVYTITLMIMMMTTVRSALSQDVLILGEIHDNPAHHVNQATQIATLQPAAVVFEMLTPKQAKRVMPDMRLDAERLAIALEWETSGWPDFSMYFPIFGAADAQIFGAAVTRDAARAAMSTGLEDAFGPEAGRYGLTYDLPPKEQTAREALQHSAHCDALPPELLPIMVDIQRLRDAVLARAVVAALDQTGGPVAVITGNGHARRDWGVPAVLGRVAPGLDVHVIGQTEENTPLDGGFDEVLSTPAVARPDPCDAFRQ